MNNLSSYLKEDYKSLPTGGYEFHCKCKECLFDLGIRPNPPSPTLPGPWPPKVKPKAQFKAEEDQYTRDYLAWEQVARDHIKTHPFGDCKFCGNVVKLSGLKNHQKSYACQERRRQKSLEDQGYIDVDMEYREAKNIFVELSKKVLNGTEWDDGPLRREVERARVRAVEYFEDLANIHLCFTHYVNVRPSSHANPEDMGWQLRAYAPRETMIALKHLLKPYNKIPNTSEHREQKTEVMLHTFAEIWQWLYADDDSRFSAVGIWEMANEDER